MCARVDASGVSDLGRQENRVAAVAETGASGQEAGPPVQAGRRRPVPPAKPRVLRHLCGQMWRARWRSPVAMERPGRARTFARGFLHLRGMPEGEGWPSQAI